MNQFYLDKIRKFEGFTARATWDYQQDTNGYGTKAQYPGEVIDKAEADRRFHAEVEKARAAVARFAPQLDEGSAAALTSLTFNAGQKWMKSGLGQSIKSGDLDTAKAIFKTYVNAGGQALPGLQARRNSEAEWFGNRGSQATVIADAVSKTAGPADQIAASATPSRSSVTAVATRAVERTTDRSARPNLLGAEVLLSELQLAAIRTSNRPWEMRAKVKADEHPTALGRLRSA
jgi:lysozyme